ncbi:MAG: hypothetical protein IIW60_04220 [Alistipes sp.]|jgi:hypothetical protein|nr:hypothetical protein [Alistipes sp.]
MDNIEQSNQQNQMLQQALNRMNEKTLSPDFKTRLMERIRQKELRREIWIGAGLATAFIGFVCLIVYLAYRIYLSNWVEIFTPENVYRLKLWTMIFITAPLFVIFDKYASPKILAFFDKIDPQK